MIKTRVLIILIILTIVACIRDNGNFKEGVRFRGIECKADNKTMILRYCFLKPLSRRHVALNFRFDFVKPIKSNLFLQVIFNYRYGNVYRQVIKTNRIDICALMQGVIDSAFIKNLLPQMGKEAQNLFQKCPYSGSLELKNYTEETKETSQSSMMPSGYYRYDITLFISDKEIASAKLATEIKSTIKDTFG
jgi:hypothetical protein